MYKKVATDMNFPAREKEITALWKQNDVIRRSFGHRKDGETFTFYDGPPTANGKPHIGHIETRVIKDLFPRFQTMKGKNVLRKAGWDTHGLPVELEVEKKLGLDGKEQVEQYGLAPFIGECKESVWAFVQESVLQGVEPNENGVYNTGQVYVGYTDGYMFVKSSEIFNSQNSTSYADNVYAQIIANGGAVIAEKTYGEKAQEYFEKGSPALAKLRNLDDLTQEEKVELETVFKP